MLEEQSRVQVAIGGGVLLHEVEAALSELNAGPAAFGAARATTAKSGCSSTSTSRRAPPKEERVDFAGDGSVGAARRELLDELIAAARPSSIVDVGCGEAFLCRVLDRALADAPGARAAARRRDRSARRSQGAGGEKRLQAHARKHARRALPRRARGPRRRRGARAAMQVDLVTCVEVVEHLDPAPLAAFGDAILGRCARVADRPTPNKEYNVCFRTGARQGSSTR